MSDRWKCAAAQSARRRFALWILLLGLAVMIVGSNLASWLTAAERNAGYLALNRALAAGDGGVADRWGARGVAALHRATERRPDDPSAWRALGFLKLLTGDEPSAVAAWRQADEMLPELLLYAQEAEAAGRTAEAADWYHLLPLVEPTDPVAWLELGMFYERMEEWTAAAAAHERGLENASPNSDLFFHLALARRHTTPPDWPAILDLSERALTTDAFLHAWSLLRTHRLRGEALAALGRLDEARDEFAWVVEQQPDDYWAILNLAQLVWEVDGDSPTAEQLFNDALSLEPNSKWSYLYLAKLYVAQGRDNEARPLFERVRELDPADATANRWLEQP
jgi:tetratricopeptide (TPR) repeat protein